MSKQDRQGTRTPAGLEQKYNFGRVFSAQEKENARQNSEMNRQNLTMADFISYATSSIDRLTKELSDANDRIEKLLSADTSFEGRMSLAEGKLKDHGERMADAEGSISGLDRRIGFAEESISDHGTRLTAAEGSISNHGEKLTAAESDINSLKSRVSALETASIA